MKNIKIKRLVAASLFAALVCVATFVSIPIPGGNGYIHFGDAVIYVAASVLPSAYAIPCAAMGAGFADFALGAAIWAPFTVVIKALMALCFRGKNKKISVMWAGIINCSGYYLAEWVLFSNPVTPVASLPFNILQSLASGVIFLVIFSIIKKK